MHYDFTCKPRKALNFRKKIISKIDIGDLGWGSNDMTWAGEALMHKCEPGECYVEWVCVLPAGRGKGLGSKLMNHAEDYAKSRGCNLF
jgi:GNAT superfamily N-acetyltransferase